MLLCEHSTQVEIFTNCRNLQIEILDKYRAFHCKKKVENELTVCTRQEGARVQLLFDCYYTCTQKIEMYKEWETSKEVKMDSPVKPGNDGVKKRK